MLRNLFWFAASLILTIAAVLVMSDRAVDRNARWVRSDIGASLTASYAPLDPSHTPRFAPVRPDR